MNDVLKNLALDKPYKAILVIGTGLIFFGLTQETKWLLNKQVVLLGSALLAFALAEWIADRRYSVFKPPNVYTGPAGILSFNVREQTPASLALHVASAILFAAFGVSFIW